MSSLPLAAISHLTAGRSQIGTSLSFHLFFAVLGVGLPLMMLVAEGMHLRTGDPVWRALARRWSKVFAVLFAVGAASGTIISFELGLLFPRFMAYAGGIIGLAVLARGRGLLPRGDLRRASTCTDGTGCRPARTGSRASRSRSPAVASAFFIVTANAWMNVPRGFQIVHGRVTHVDPLAAMFNPAWATETSHMIFGAYLATAFGVATSTPSACSAAAATHITARRLAWRCRSAAILAPLQVGGR